VARLDGKIAIVTGGSRGIGRAIVEQFLAEGASVVATARSAPQQAFPASRSFLFLAADVSRSADVDSIFARCQAHFGDPDILVNNAGSRWRRPSRRPRKRNGTGSWRSI
jgi:NAD(P)-dependent dehydrogenase (short-subunit alcohol dehydrogenase family)